VLPPGLDAAGIDAAVRERTLAGDAIYELDRDALAALEPDLIVTQALCPVCAVSYDEVAALASELPSAPQVIALDPKTLGETLGDVRTVAESTGAREQGAALVQDTDARVERVRRAVRGAARPRVAAIEWFDPVYVAGHWTPQMIELAGGEDVLAGPGRRPSAAAGRSSQRRSPTWWWRCRAATTHRAHKPRRWPTHSSCARSAPHRCLRSTRPRTSRGPGRV